MSALLPIKVTCDGHLPHPTNKYATGEKCEAATDAAIKLSFSKTSKLKGEIQLPSGWISARDHYSDDGAASYYCPVCGPAKQPWMYKK